MTTENKPFQKISSSKGMVATMWKKPSKHGFFYNTTVTKTYKDDQGNYQETTSFSGEENLIAAYLRTEAYKLEIQDRATEKSSAKEESMAEA